MTYFFFQKILRTSETFIPQTSKIDKFKTVEILKYIRNNINKNTNNNMKTRYVQ